MIFVTGGSGFLGRHLVATLCRAGYSLRVLTRQPAANRWLCRYPRVEVIHGDLRDKTLLNDVLQGCEYVVHAGGVFRFWGKPEWFFETNVQGTENVLAAANAAGVKRVVHISSTAVIGQPDPNAIITEDTPAHPSDPYQQSKLEGEQRVLHYFHENGLPVVILRPGAYYGPMGAYAFNRLFFTDPMRGIIMQVNGGRHIIFPVYIGDVARAAMQSLTGGVPGEVYNICGDWITHKEAFDIITQEANLRFPRLPVPGWLGISMAWLLTAISTITRREPFYPINLRSYVYNNWRVSSEKARRELGFVPIDFRTGAKQTIAWYRAGQPDEWPEVACAVE